MFVPRFDNEENLFDDFLFCDENERNDFSQMALYFLSNKGEIFCHTPFLFQGFRIRTDKLQFLESIHKDKKDFPCD